MLLHDVLFYGTYNFDLFIESMFTKLVYLLFIQAFQISNLIREYIEVLRTGVGCATNGDLRHVAQLVAVAGGSCANSGNPGNNSGSSGNSAALSSSDQLAFG